MRQNFAPGGMGCVINGAVVVWGAVVNWAFVVGHCGCQPRSRGFALGLAIYYRIIYLHIVSHQFSELSFLFFC